MFDEHLIHLAKIFVPDAVEHLMKGEMPRQVLMPNPLQGQKKAKGGTNPLAQRHASASPVGTTAHLWQKTSTGQKAAVPVGRGTTVADEPNRRGP